MSIMDHIANVEQQEPKIDATLLEALAGRLEDTTMTTRKKLGAHNYTTSIDHVFPRPALDTGYSLEADGLRHQHAAEAEAGSGHECLSNSGSQPCGKLASSRRDGKQDLHNRVG